MTPHPEREELMAWRDGEVSEARATDIGSHVESCGECRGFVEALATVSARLATWTPDAPSATAAPAAPTSPARTVRRTVLWAAAAVLVVGVLASVRVDCAPAPTCERHTWRLSFFPRESSTGPALPDQAQAMSPAQRIAFEIYWNSKKFILDGKERPRLLKHSPVEVMMFIDWQCPACRAEYRAYKPVLDEFASRQGQRFSYGFLDYPLNKRCNEHVSIELHSAACEAAAAVRLAAERGTEAAMIDWLFNNQESLTPASVATAARTIGKISDFDARVASREMQAMVGRGVYAGKVLGVTSTPTLIINGVLARGEDNRLFTAEEVRAAIEIELGKIK